MQDSGGITAPATVGEGDTTPIVIVAPQVTTLRITVLETGEEFQVTVGRNDRALFELPTGAVAGSSITISDKCNPDNFTTIDVVDPGSPP